MQPSGLGEALLRMLLWDVRYLTRPQDVRALRALGMSDDGSARRLTRQLVADGLVGSSEVLVRPLLDLSEPLYSWTPDEGRPRYEELPRLAWALESRWQQPASSAPVWFATERALGVFGGVGPGRIHHPGQVTHDLHVTQVYLRHLERDPEAVRAWVSEDAVTGHVKFQKRPDAIWYDLTSDPPRPLRACEVGGFYPEEKLRAFFEDMERRGLAFDLM